MLSLKKSRSLAIGSAMAVAMAATAFSSTVQAAGPQGLEDTSRYVFVPNRGSADVAVIDTQTDRVVTRIAVGQVPHQVAVSDSLDRLVTSNTEDNTISIVDLKTLETTATLLLASEPEHMALNPDGDVAAVASIGAGKVSLVSLADGRELARIDGFHEPHNLTWSPKGDRLFVANLGADHVTVVDVANARISAELSVAPARSVAARAEATEGEFQGIVNVTPTRDGRLGFAAHGDSGRMAVIDLHTGQVTKSLDVGTQPWRAFSTTNGRYMLVPNNGDETVAVIDTWTQELIKVLPGAADMTGINTGWFDRFAFVISRGEDKAVVLDLDAMAKVGEIPLMSEPETGVTTPDGTKLYVALGGTDRVAVIDTRERRLIGYVDGVGKEPWGAHMVGSVNYCH